jgi:hypothetical protein
MHGSLKQILDVSIRWHPSTHQCDAKFCIPERIQLFLVRRRSFSNFHANNEIFDGTNLFQITLHKGDSPAASKFDMNT